MPFPLLKLLFLLVFLSALLLLLLYVTLSTSLPVTARPSLFPTSAIISLAEDNSTFFLSRPAAFGPSLPKIGLTGELYALEEAQLACEDVEDTDPISQGRKDHSLLLEAFGNGRVTDAEIYDGPFAEKNPTAAFAKLGQDEKLDVSVKGVNKGQVLHADIETLQESAAIQGKIVLVTRGGCGFLEKVMWSQRRGAVAVIVGDNEAHRPLLTMYAKGDTSNVTIPSIFTSYTTSHLLISLIPKKSNIGTRPKSSKPKDDVPITFPTMLATSLSSTKSESSLQPSKDDPLLSVHDSSTPDLRAYAVVQGVSGNREQEHKGDDSTTLAENVLQAKLISDEDSDVDTKHRSSMSGELGQNSAQPKLKSGIVKGQRIPTKGQKAIFNAALGPHDEDGRNVKPGSIGFEGLGWIDSGKSKFSFKGLRIEKEPNMREGLWITLTPTRMSSSPLVDTLLVLVVSPLVTLTVVYTMLLLRSRYRRRRWRAPKSVVDQLPVRTYHSPSRTPSPAPAVRATTTTLSPDSFEKRSGASTPTRRSSSRGRPLPEATASTSALPATNLNPLPAPQSNTSSNTVVFRYFPPSRECVVCLEEYIDGVSRIMRLPCGHEFHVDCITPWLMTRRRTCPICKKCVVSGLGLDSAGIGSAHPTPSLGFFGRGIARTRAFFGDAQQQRGRSRRMSERTPLIDGEEAVENNA